MHHKFASFQTQTYLHLIGEMERQRVAPPSPLQSLGLGSLGFGGNSNNPANRISNSLRGLTQEEQQEDVGQGDRLVAAKFGLSGTGQANSGSLLTSKLQIMGQNRNSNANNPVMRGMFGPQPAPVMLPPSGSN